MAQHRDTKRITFILPIIDPQVDPNNGFDTRSNRFAIEFNQATKINVVGNADRRHIEFSRALNGRVNSADAVDHGKFSVQTQMNKVITLCFGVFLRCWRETGWFTHNNWITRLWLAYVLPDRREALTMNFCDTLSRQSCNMELGGVAFMLCKSIARVLYIHLAHLLVASDFGDN